MALVKEYGEMWARNISNIRAIPRSEDGGQGVYVLYDGSMPLYVGKGNIHSRISRAARSLRRGQCWDHFSWYIIPDPDLRHDIESLFLRTLPWYVRALTEQSGKFKHGKKSRKKPDPKPDPITRRRPRPKSG